MSASGTIKRIQQAVGVKADGIWGPNTLKAVASALGCGADAKTVQKAVGVAQDGIIGPKTHEAILKALDPVARIQALVGVKGDGIWGPNTLKAVAAALGCAASVKAVQGAVGVAQDGVAGAKTHAAVLAALKGGAAPAKPAEPAKPSSGRPDVFLDAGHTADFEREHPNQFKGVDWAKGDAAKVASALKFDARTNDSLEHILNVAIALSFKRHAEALGLKVEYYDDPKASNSAEISQVYRRSNAAKPRCFLSIHNNALGAKGWDSLACTPSGSVALYCKGRSAGKALAESAASALRSYRKAAGGPDNRASITATSSVAVLSKADSSIPATLVEVGFYDNIRDLLWMAEHVDGIGEALAKAVKSHLG